jgi:hypothetical protein
MDRRIAERMIAVLEVRLSLSEDEVAARRAAINALCYHAGLSRRYPGAPHHKSAAYEAALAAVEQMVHDPIDGEAIEIDGDKP